MQTKPVKVGSIRGSHSDKGTPGRSGSIGKPNVPSGSARFAKTTTGAVKKMQGGRQDEHARADKAKAKKP